MEDENEDQQHRDHQGLKPPGMEKGDGDQEKGEDFSPSSCGAVEQARQSPEQSKKKKDGDAVRPGFLREVNIERKERCENPGPISDGQGIHASGEKGDKKYSTYSEKGRRQTHGKIAGRKKAYPVADPIIQGRLLLMGRMASDLIKRMGIKGNLKQFVDPQALEVQVVKPEGQRKEE